MSQPAMCDPTVEDCSMPLSNTTDLIEGPGGPPLMAKLAQYSLLAVGAA